MLRLRVRIPPLHLREALLVVVGLCVGVYTWVQQYRAVVAAPTAAVDLRGIRDELAGIKDELRKIREATK